MGTWGISMMKDERDFVDFVVPWMANQLDHLLIADNLSSDGTFERLLELSDKHKNIIIVRDEEVAYYQADKMNALVKQAADIDPYISWVVPFDADEMWFSRTSSISETLEQCEFDVLICDMWHMVSVDEHTSKNPLLTMRMRRISPEPFPKVVFKYRPDAYLQMGNHGVDYPNAHIGYNLLEVKHYQYRSFEHFRRKTVNGKRAYDATNFNEFTGAHWREYGAMTDDELREIWNEWLKESDLILDPW